MVITGRVSCPPLPGAEALLTDEFVEYLAALHDRFAPRVAALREKRAAVLDTALKERVLPTHPPVSEANTGDWRVPPVPDDLRTPGIEITGPASITGMFINALNPGPDGERAVGDLDDDEDAGGHRLIDTLAAARNRLGAVERTLTYTNPGTGKDYFIRDGDLPFFMHREKGLHLDEPEVAVDGNPVPAAILGTALTLFHCGRAQIERGQGVYFYLPKMESAAEAAFWRDFFDFSRECLDLPEDATIRAVPLVESLPAAFQMEEMLYELGPYAAGLNAARWDFKASIFEFVMTDPRLGVAGPVRRRHQDDRLPGEHIPSPRRRLPQEGRGADRRDGHSAAQPRRRGQPLRSGVHRRRQAVGGPPGLPQGLGRPHLPHGHCRTALQGASRLRLDAHPRDG